MVRLIKPIVLLISKIMRESRHEKKKDKKGLQNKIASYMQVVTCTFNVLMSALLSMLMSYPTHSAQKQECHILY